MRNLALFLVLILLCALPLLANAKPKERQRALDAVQLDAIRGLFESSHSDQHRERLIFAYEGYLIQYCREELSKNLAKPNTEETEVPGSCVAMLRGLAELLPNNPLAICFKQGFQSPDCSQAYAKIEIKPASEFVNLDTNIKFGSGLSETETSQVSELQSKITQISEDTAIEAATKRSLLIENYVEILKIACKAAVNKYSANFSARVRYIPNLCYETTQTLLKTDPRNSQAICYREGFIAPRCQFAPAGKQATTSSGLEQF